MGVYCTTVQIYCFGKNLHIRYYISLKLFCTEKGHSVNCCLFVSNNEKLLGKYSNRMPLEHDLSFK